MPVIITKRKRLYRLLALANRELAKSRACWTEEDYRAALYRFGAKEVAGKFSATTMSEKQMQDALAHFKTLGFHVKHSGKPRFSSWRQPRISKLNAMWCALADKGVVRNRSEEALQSFCLRHIKAKRLQWASSEELNVCIEVVKRFGERNSVTLEG